MTTTRIALGIAYRGQAYQGWQSQPSGRTVQDHLEKALSTFADEPVSTLCAGRTDAGVHALAQVVHFDSDAARSERAWRLGANTYLPADVSIAWVREVPGHFHARYSALARVYRYIILNRDSRAALAAGHLTLVPQLREALAQHGRPDIMVVVGGVIPPDDVPTLLEMGASAVFLPGTVIAESALGLLETLSEQLGHKA